MNQTDTPEYTAEQKNLRRNLRAPLIVEKIPCEDSQKSFFGYAKNISGGGLFIATVKPREPGERFVLELTLPGKERIKICSTCEVVWKRHFERKGAHEPGMGLKFVDLPADRVALIDQWVLAQSGSQPK